MKTLVLLGSEPKDSYIQGRDTPYLSSLSNAKDYTLKIFQENTQYKLYNAQTCAQPKLPDSLSFSL